jgi:diphosphomevalonate decarboxylase
MGKIAESNALAMHATMLSAWPPIGYSLPETIALMQKIWQLRNEGLALFFTQDAGPNLKLLFEENNTANVLSFFPELEMIKPFQTVNSKNND